MSSEPNTSACRIVVDASRLQRSPSVKGEQYRSGSCIRKEQQADSRIGRVQRRHSLNLGGNTDCKIRPKLYLA